MTADEFLQLQTQLWTVFGPLVQWLIMFFIAGGVWTAVTMFALIVVREIADSVTTF